jgi:hypothetical protein
VETRTKKAPHVARAAGEQKISIDDILLVDDVIGGRVVVMTLSDIAAFWAAIHQDDRCPVHDLRKDSIEDESGYRATHIKGIMSHDELEIGCEIQVRTALADAWAVISRADLYRRRDLHSVIPRIAQIQSKSLAAIDEALELIRTEAATPVATTGGDIENQPPTPPVIVELDFANDAERDLIAGTISEKRKQAFLSSYLQDRSKSGTIERLFSRAGTFRQSPEFDKDSAWGFNIVLHKGPFVDGSNWADYTTWQFAVEAERTLMRKFTDSMNQSGESRGQISRDWPEIVAAIRRSSEEMRSIGYRADIAILGGDVDVDFLVEAHKHLTPKWELDRVKGSLGNWRPR